MQMAKIGQVYFYLFFIEKLGLVWHSTSTTYEQIKETYNAKELDTMQYLHVTSLEPTDDQGKRKLY